MYVYICESIDIKLIYTAGKIIWLFWNKKSTYGNPLFFPTPQSQAYYSVRNSAIFLLMCFTYWLWTVFLGLYFL